MLSIDRIAAQVSGLVEQVGRSLAADEDWRPVMFLFDEEGSLSLAGVDSALLSAEENREELLARLPEIISANRAHAIAFVATVVSHSFSPTEAPSSGPAEMVQLQVVTADSQRVLYAAIERSVSDPPKLGGWQERSGQLEPESFVSRFIETAQQALA